MPGPVNPQVPYQLRVQLFISGRTGGHTSVGHRQLELLVVLDVKVLVLELLSVDALSSRTVSPGEVSTLEHEALDTSVEQRSLVTYKT